MDPFWVYKPRDREASERLCCGVLAGTAGATKLEDSGTCCHGVQQLVSFCFKMQLLHGVEFIPVGRAARNTRCSLFGACNSTLQAGLTARKPLKCSCAPHRRDKTRAVFCWAAGHTAQIWLSRHRCARSRALAVKCHPKIRAEPLL